MRIEADDLQTAYQRAAEELKCSVTQLDIKILQNPSSGFLGFFKKTAIIEVSKQEVKGAFKNDNRSEKFEKKKEFKKEKPFNDEQKQRSDKKKHDKKQHQKEQQKEQSKRQEFNTDAMFKSDETPPLVEIKKSELKPRDNKLVIDNSILDTFNKNDFDDSQDLPKIEEISSQETKKQNKQEKENRQKSRVDMAEILPEIKDGLTKLFCASDFKIDKIDVSKFDEDTILIELDGQDAALLIGKEGYRYKAISYLLYNWISSKYNFAIRLEIAEFLKNQEAAMQQYLQGIFERVQNTGRAKTKPLDGVLVKIALEKLRTKFPDKYVNVKSSNGEQFVVVNDFLKK